jgi:hypothetical protein
MSAVSVAGAAVLGGTNAELDAPEAGAPEEEAPDDGALELAAPEVAAADDDAELEVEPAELAAVDELEPQALTTRALAATTANNIARVVRDWVDATFSPMRMQRAPPPRSEGGSWRVRGILP